MKKPKAIPPYLSSGRQIAERPSGPGTAFANFLIDALPPLGLTNDTLATRLGYARPTIISMWKTARTKVTLDVLSPLAELLHVDIGYLLALYFEQYIENAHGGVTSFTEILDTVRRIVTPEEIEIINVVRSARRGNSLPLTKKQKDTLLGLFRVPAGTTEGPYRASWKIDLTGVGAGDRKRFERRGRIDDSSITEEEEVESRAAIPNRNPRVKKVVRGDRT
jgi:hypothetical protein